MILPERFWAKVERTGRCWHWTAAKLPTGYGQFRLAGIMRYAHRLSYEAAKGAIPKGLHIDHLCRNRDCVNPAHLEAVTNQENILRGLNPTAQRERHKAQTTCRRGGHPLSGPNLHVNPAGSRVCKECQRAALARHRAKKRRKG